MRLIDGDELIVKLYQDQPMNWTGSDAEVQELNDWELFRNMVDNASTVDAVPVVHCKDCRYFKMYKCRMGYSNYNDFCSYGEKNSEVS